MRTSVYEGMKRAYLCRSVCATTTTPAGMGVADVALQGCRIPCADNRATLPPARPCTQAANIALVSRWNTRPERNERTKGKQQNEAAAASMGEKRREETTDNDR